MIYEYLALPAPTQSKRSKGVKTAVERLALAMTDSINEMAEEGWEYMRTETLTVEDKPGRLSKVVERIETVMIFRREKAVQTMANPLLRENREALETVKPVIAHESDIAEEPALSAKSVREEPPVMMSRESAPRDAENTEVEPARSLGGVSRD